MQLQAFIKYERQAPSKHLFQPVSNEPKGTEEFTWRGKPSGGFWTSHYNAEYVSAYARSYKEGIYKICRSGIIREQAHEVWLVPYMKVWTLKPSESAKIAVIDSLNDFYDLRRKYGYVDHQFQRTREESSYTSSPTVTVRSLNFEAIAEDYDALHLTEKGWGCDKEGDAIGVWHCESTVWFKWMFEEIKDKGYLWADFPRVWHGESVRHMRGYAY